MEIEHNRSEQDSQSGISNSPESQSDISLKSDDEDDLNELLVRLKEKCRDRSRSSSQTLVEDMVWRAARKARLSKPLQVKQINSTRCKAKVEVRGRFEGNLKVKNAQGSCMDWNELPRQELTSEVKREIQAMRLHRTLDPQTFVKGGIEKSLKEPIPERFLFGHVVSSTPSCKAANKKRTFVESLVNDKKSKAWSKRKYLEEVQVRGASGGKKFAKRKKDNRRR